MHEIGHSLGLSHSDSRAAIMAPFHKVLHTLLCLILIYEASSTWLDFVQSYIFSFQGYMPNIQLAQDDILAIQVFLLLP